SRCEPHLSPRCEPHPLAPSPLRGEGERPKSPAVPLSAMRRGGQGVRFMTQGVRFTGGGEGGLTGHAYPIIHAMADGAELTLDVRRLVGRWSLRSAGHAGRFTFLLLDMLSGLAEWRIYLPRTFEQATNVGFGSL